MNPNAPKATVLVVDDNDTGRYTKSRVLRQAGFEVNEAANGAEALRLIEEWKRRLVVLDIHLPDIDGWEICRRVKSNPETASILILQLSATFVSEADTVRSLEGGADGCLTEPLEAPVLVATVRALLRARQAEDQLRDALVREQAARATAEIANRTKDDFLAVLSHELRSPLGVIVTWVSLLRSGKVEKEREARALEAIERNARIQIKLIEDLLDVSRIISGKMLLDTTLLELGPVIEAAIESVRPAADAKSIRVRTHVDATVGPISGDATRLQQVVWNLLSNAVKFTPRGGEVDIRAEAQESQAQIQVTDTGKGISAEFLPFVFDRFRQADSSTTRAEGGLGLGLAIVRHLVELHGGTVEASSPGESKGTTFTIRLPLPALRKASGTPAPKGSAASEGTAPNRLEGLRILVVDDEADARDAIIAVLEGCGAAVTAAENVNDALGTIERSHPDLVVSDIGMPIEDGYALIRRIRELPSAPAGTIPALALTAYGTRQQQNRIIEAGYQACLTKPVDANDLVAAVARIAAGLART